MAVVEATAEIARIKVKAECMFVRMNNAGYNPLIVPTFYLLSPVVQPTSLTL